MENHHQDVLRNDNWAVLCPGPSLKDVTEVQHDPGCLIAVNGAILHDAALVANWWALLDPEVFKSCCAKADMRFYAPFVTLWTHYNFENAGTSAGNRCWGFGSEMHKIFKRFMAEHWEFLGEMGKFTVLTALELARLHGAKRIRLYGADMAGAGYFENGFENSRTQHHEKRWTDERECFERAVKSYENLGISVERISND